MKSMIVAVLLAVPGLLAAAPVAVLPVQGTNLSEGEGAAVGVLLASRYAFISEQEVLAPTNPKVVQAAQGAASPQEAAASLGVSEYITVDAVMLRSKMVVTAALYERGGTLIHRSKATAGSLDDMELVAERLALSLHRRSAYGATQNIRNVTQTESRLPNRTWSEKVVGVRTGLSVPLAAGVKLQPVANAGFDMRLENDKGFLEWGVALILPADVAGGRGYGGLAAELGGAVYLGNDSVSPYVGGGVSPRLVGGLGNNSPVSFAAYGMAGLMFMRESSTRIYSELRVAQNVVPLGRVGDSDVYPTEVGLQVGIGW